MKSSRPPISHAAFISLLVHALILLIIILGLPHLRRKTILPPEKPIAITLMESPPEPEPAPTPAPAPAAPEKSAAEPSTPAAQAAPEPPKPEQPAPPPQQEQQATSDQQPQQPMADAPSALPYDPSFNAFALAPRSEVRTVPSEVASLPAPIATPPGPQAIAPEAADNGQGDGLSEGRGAINGDGDPKNHPQYLRIQLNGFVNAIYANELHRFLQRLIECGVVPIPASNPNLSIEADVTFMPNGIVQSAQLSNQGAFGNDPSYARPAAELMGALSKPGCAFIRLPVQNYPVWHTVHISFFQRIPQ